MAEEEGRGTTPPAEGPAAPKAHTATDEEAANAEARNAKAAESAMERAEAAEADARLWREKAVAAMAEAEANKRTAEIVNDQLAKEKASAIGKMNSAVKERDQLRKARDDAEERDAEDQPKLAIRQFVSQSLVDIMAGVDEAAAARKTAELNGAIAGLLTSVTTIGATTAERRASDRVEFDLAVTVAKSEKDDQDWGVEVQADAKASFLGIFKAGGSLAARYQRALTEAMSQQQAHRIRFSVPIVYAVQDDHPSEE